jgi:AAA domain
MLDLNDAPPQRPHREKAAQRRSGHNRIDFRAVSEAANRSVELIVGRYLPGGRWAGNEYTVRNPARNDSRPGSFKINRKGIWSDFATGDKGDMIDLVALLTGKSKLEGARELADLLGVRSSNGSTAHQGNASGKKTSSQRAASPQEAATVPKEFPRFTEPDADGKPRFIEVGDQGPRLQSFEKRRHVYRQGGVPVRIKVMRADGATNYYRVTSDLGKTGWQPKKPEGHLSLPYFKDGTNPFATAGDIYWPEGEKDTDTLADAGLSAFTFGGVGDGLPAGCEEFVRGRDVVILADNDDAGREHAEKKAALAFKVAKSVRVVHFPDVAEKGDVSDWLPHHSVEELLKRVSDTDPWVPDVEAPEATCAPDDNPPPIELFWHGRKYERELRPMLIEELIPETGKGLASGQWGAAKTFCMIDMAASVMTGTPFAGREVVRQGGVLFVAAEGATEIPIRLEGLVEHKLRPAAQASAAAGAPIAADLDALPFAWIERYPISKAPRASIACSSP